MSMSLLTVFQFLGTLLAYLLITLALPCTVLSKKLHRYAFAERVLLYFIIGSFYSTNLVMLLELLHIANYFTIMVGLLIIPAVFGCWLNRFPLVDGLKAFGVFFIKVLTGTIGVKSAVKLIREKSGSRVTVAMKKIGRSIRKDWPDWLLTAALIIMVLFVYGVRMLRDYGYTMSDIPVHLSWVNGLSENKLFVEGIYPFGMHTMIYLIHTVFRIDSYVVFRVFGLVQCLTIHMMALLFLRLCCKSRFAAYTGVFLYTLGSYVASNNIIRYLSALPQETSMIYILPTAYFAFMFFWKKSEELKAVKAIKDQEKEREKNAELATAEAEQSEAADEPVAPAALETPEADTVPTAAIATEPEEAVGEEAAVETETVDNFVRTVNPWKMVSRVDSRIALMGLAMSFSLCLSAHTYGAVIAAFFCIGIGIGFIGWIVRPAYFSRIIATALVGLTITLLPMLIAYVMGTPIQDSFLWAKNVITGSAQQEQIETPPVLAPDQEGLPGLDLPDGAVGNDIYGQSSANQGSSTQTVKKPGLLEKARQWCLRLWDSTRYRIESHVLGFSYIPSSVLGTYIRLSTFPPAMMLVLLLAGLAFLPFRRLRLYGAMLLSTGIFMILMSVMFSASFLGIPALMDADRLSIFYSYMLIIVIGLAVDVCLFLLNMVLGKRWNMDVLSFAVVALIVIFLWQDGDLRASLVQDGLESNEAVTCLSNIIATEKDNTWTIFSANDETQMVYGHGYHYDLSTFLEEISVLDGDHITVPTQTVYFFIEKIPLDYVYSYRGSGQPVSRKGALNPVPKATADDVYLRQNRWIIMSHMYFWAQEFQRMYPNEMKVYMETDRFVCYRLVQNEYRLYNLAIDYGYNSTVSEEQ